MSSPDTNLLLVAALGAGGLWLFHDREKHRRAAEDATTALAMVAPLVPSAAARVAAGPVPARRAEGRTPTARAERIKLASRSYDPLFAAYGGDIPVAYLRALAAHESGLNPRATDGPAWGLLQVVEVVRKDYNARHGTRYERRDLLDPAVNIAIASDVLTRIIDGYARFHGDAPNLQVDWSNPLFIELLTLGWNAGFSERGGVGRVASHLSRRGFVDFTLDDIVATAKQAGASPNLSNPHKARFARLVTTQYLRERARDQAEGVTPNGAGADADAATAAAAAPQAEAQPVTNPAQVDAALGEVG